MRHRARFLAGLVLVAIPVGSVATWIRVALDPSYLRAGVVSQVGIFGLFTFYFLARTRHVDLAGWTMCAAIQVVAVVTSIYSHEHWVLLGYVAAPIVLSGIVLPVRGTLAAGAVGALMLVARGLIAPFSDFAVFLSAALPFLSLLTLLVVLSVFVREGVERDRLAQLREGEAHYRRLFEETFEGHVIVKDGVIREVKGAFAELLGRSEVIGAPLLQVFSAAGPAFERTLERRGVTELAYHPKGAEPRDLEVLVTEAPWQGDQATVVAVRDVSERRRLGRVLETSERSLALGQVAAGVAHEINNPLTFVTANIHLLEEKLSREARSSVALELEEMAQGAERIRVIVDDLRALARTQGNKGAVDVHSVLELAIRMTHNEVAQRATIVKKLGAVGPVEGNAARLGQVFVNLIVNAARAIPAGNPDAQRITLVTRQGADNRIEIDVEDTGPGIPSEVLPRIFDPFFTTRDVGGGMGLGLSICQSIVKAHGGSLSVKTGPTGTVFTVQLNPAKPRATPTKPPSPVEAPRGRRALVIDDEPALGRTIARLLKGCVVEVATSGEEGLRLAREKPFDVIFCDLIMPHTTGLDVYNALAADGHGLEHRLVIMTGGAFTPELRTALAEFPNIVLEKPMTQAALFEACEAVVSGGNRASLV
ncbi:MAG: ATP-binding protein [Polyangiaceae bacterium]